MSYEGDLSAQERERIVGYVNDRLQPTRDRDAHAQWADTLIAAFDAVGRPIVFLDSDGSPGFLLFSTERGTWDKFRPLEIESLLHDCGRDAKLKQASVTTIMRALRARAGVQSSFFDNGRRAVAFVDCTLVFDWNDPHIVTAYEHSPANRARTHVPIRAQSGGGKEQLDEFLDAMFGDPIAIKRLTELIGFAFFGEGALCEKIVLIHADGGNGKGTFARLVRSIFPRESLTAIPPKDIPPEWGRAQLQGSRINLVGEVDRLHDEDISVLKALAGGDLISARNSKERGFTMETEAFHLYATNHIPRLGRRTPALSRRFVVVPSALEVPVGKQNPLFKRKLADESASAFLNLCIENMREAALLMRAGVIEFEMSAAMEAATAELYGSDHIDDFIEGHLVPGDMEADRIRTEEVRAAYVAYCNQRRMPPVGPARLIQRLKQAGYEPRKLDGGLMHLVGVKRGPSWEARDATLATYQK